MASKQCLPPIIHILARQRAAQAAGPAVVASVTETVCPAQANFMAHLRAPIARMRTPQETPMPRPARTQALPRPSVLLAATLLPLLGLWLARPVHAMETLGDTALAEVQAAGWTGLPLSTGDLGVIALSTSPVATARDSQQQSERQALALQQFSTSVALQTQLATAQRVVALPTLAYVIPPVIPVVGLPLAFFVPPTHPH